MKGGWVRIPNALIQHELAKIGPISFSIYATIASHANREGVAYPSVRRICEIVGISTNTFSRHFRKLEENGLVSRQVTRGARTQYFLRSVASDATVGNGTVASPATPSVANREAECRDSRPVSVAIDMEHNKQQEQDSLTTDESKPEADFEEFWQRYPLRENKRAGSKKEASDQWKKLSIKDRRAAIGSLEAYREQANGYPKDACRYLKKGLWSDFAEPDPIRVEDMTIDNDADVDAVLTMKALELRKQEFGDGL